MKYHNSMMNKPCYEKNTLYLKYYIEDLPFSAAVKNKSDSPKH